MVCKHQAWWGINKLCIVQRNHAKSRWGLKSSGASNAKTCVLEELTRSGQNYLLRIFPLWKAHNAKWVPYDDFYGWTNMSGEIMALSDAKYHSNTTASSVALPPLLLDLTFHTLDPSGICPGHNCFRSRLKFAFNNRSIYVVLKFTVISTDHMFDIWYFAMFMSLDLHTSSKSLIAIFFPFYSVIGEKSHKIKITFLVICIWYIRPWFRI